MGASAGGITEAVAVTVTPGDHVSAHFQDLGSVNVRFANP